MRILHFYKTFFPDSTGGIEETIRQLARGGARHGIHAEVLSLTRERNAPVIKEDGYSVHRVHRDFEIASTGFSLSVFRRFAELARQADIVHYHFPWPLMDAVHFATRIGKPTILTYHSDIVRQKRLLALYRPLMNRFLDSVDVIVATSPNYLATSGVLERHREKVRVIPIGLDRQACQPTPPERLDHWRAVLGGRFFLFVGALRYYKGLHILLDAARNAPFPIAIVGVGPIERELKAQAQRLDLKTVHFLGHLPDTDKAALLQLCLGVVFPSHLRSEAFGVSLLEGAVYGKPLISSEIGTGTSFVNIASRTGLVVPPSAPLALRQAMDFLWDNPDEAARMGANARERFEAHFTAGQMVKAYAGLYRELHSRGMA